MLTLIRALRKDASHCTRCGSADFYPDPGPLGALLHLVHLARHRCRGCREAFWLRSGAGPRPQASLFAVGQADPLAADKASAPPDPAALDAAFAAQVRAEPPATGERSLAALDRTPAPAVAAAVDLRTLDAEIDRLRAVGRRGRGPDPDSDPDPAA